MVSSKASRASLRSRQSVGSEVAVTDATASSAATAHTPPLLRKSSSTRLLDGAGVPPGGNPTDAKSDAFPKLQRKSSSLQDMNERTEPRRQSEKPRGKKSGRKHSSGWTTPKTAAVTKVTDAPLPQLNSSATKPQLNSSATKPHLNSSATKPQLNRTSTRYVTGRPTRSKRAGDIALSREATIDVVVKYQLGQHELKKFKQCFRQIDLDASGVIDYDEFFEFIDETKTPFSEGLFRMIDSDSNGTIDYEEFVHAMVLYCMYTRDEILQFAFNTFDPAKTGAIGEKEFKRLISVVNDGQPVYPGNFKNALNEFDRNKDGLLDFDEFKIMNKRYPMLLFPCFRLQDRMQKATLGESHWLELHKRLYQKLKLENYRRKHNGELPALSLVGTIRKFFHLDSMDVYQP